MEQRSFDPGKAIVVTCYEENVRIDLAVANQESPPMLRLRQIVGELKRLAEQSEAYRAPRRRFVVPGQPLDALLV